jgi:glucan 1,3-beta-glucosidase
VPVTYADVWNSGCATAIAAAVDFVTVHILPYWEDFPIPARCCVTRRRYPQADRDRVSDKEVFIGEFDGRAPAGCEKAPCRRR